MLVTLLVWINLLARIGNVSDAEMFRAFNMGIGMIVDPLSRLVLRGSWDRYAGIDAALVAKAMAVLAGRDQPGIYRYHNREIRAFAS